MTTSPALRERWNRKWRRRREARLAIARRGRTTCPKRIGVGVCGGLLEDRVLRGGQVVTLCDRCERKRLGLCRHCPAPVQGRAIYCPTCLRHARRQAERKYRRTHLDQVRRAKREHQARYRLANGEAIRERARLRRQEQAPTPSCRRCGELVAWAGIGRPRLDCTTCRPGRVR